MILVWGLFKPPVEPRVETTPPKSVSSTGICDDLFLSRQERPCRIVLPLFCPLDITLVSYYTSAALYTHSEVFQV